MKLMRFLGALALPAVLAACVAERAPPPAPPPVQAAAPPAPPQPPPSPQWEDLDTTAGSWSYVEAPSATEARFQAAGPQGRFILRCNPQSRLITLLLDQGV